MGIVNFSMVLAEIMSEENVTVSQLSERTGYTYQHISQILKGVKNPSWQCVQDLLGALRYSIKFSKD